MTRSKPIDREERMPDLIRYNVRSMYVDGLVSWEYQADDNGQWLPADTTLDRINGLVAENTRLRESLRKVIADACREAGYDQAGEAAERFWKRIDAALK